MKTKQTLFLTMALLLAILLAACGGDDTAEPESPAAADTAQPIQEAPATSGEPLSGAHTFVVVTEGSQASFIASEEFFADALAKYGIEAGDNVVVGTTPGVTGEIQLDFSSAEPVQSAQFTVDMTGLQTDQSQRDNWLEDNAIQTNAFPEATFTATSVTGLPESIQEGQEVSFQMNGDLTVRDVTKNVTFDVTAVISGNTLEGTATLDLNMTDFGITPPDFANTLTVNDPFTIEIQLTAQSS